MPRRMILLAAALTAATPALALDLPTRKAGLWEIKMEFQGHSRLPMQAMRAMHRCDVGQIDDL